MELRCGGVDLEFWSRDNARSGSRQEGYLQCTHCRHTCKPCLKLFKMESTWPLLWPLYKAPTTAFILYRILLFIARSRCINKLSPPALGHLSAKPSKSMDSSFLASATMTYTTQYFHVWPRPPITLHLGWGMMDTSAPTSAIMANVAGWRSWLQLV